MSLISHSTKTAMDSLTAMAIDMLNRVQFWTGHADVKQWLYSLSTDPTRLGRMLQNFAHQSLRGLSFAEQAELILPVIWDQADTRIKELGAPEAPDNLQCESLFESSKDLGFRFKNAQACAAWIRCESGDGAS